MGANNRFREGFRDIIKDSRSYSDLGNRFHVLIEPAESTMKFVEKCSSRFTYDFKFDEIIVCKICSARFVACAVSLIPRNHTKIFMLDSAISLKPWNPPPNLANDYLEYLGEFEVICETALARESGLKGGLMFEKKTRFENLVTLPL
jgi:hypothetical protein